MAHPQAAELLAELGVRSSPTYRRICDARGRYVWQRGALRRAP
ncbi:hypothetical protein ACMHYB_40365 [Sorangium sp. So ce1128]